MNNQVHKAFSFGVSRLDVSQSSKGTNWQVEIDFLNFITVELVSFMWSVEGKTTQGNSLFLLGSNTLFEKSSAPTEENEAYYASVYLQNPLNTTLLDSNIQATAVTGILDSVNTYVIFPINGMFMPRKPIKLILQDGKMIVNGKADWRQVAGFSPADSTTYNFWFSVFCEIIGTSG